MTLKKQSTTCSNNEETCIVFTRYVRLCRNLQGKEVFRYMGYENALWNTLAQWHCTCCNLMADVREIMTETSSGVFVDPT